jgi:hypothetical protein
MGVTTTAPGEEVAEREPDSAEQEPDSGNDLVAQVDVCRWAEQELLLMGAQLGGSSVIPMYVGQFYRVEDGVARSECPIRGADFANLGTVVLRYDPDYVGASAWNLATFEYRGAQGGLGQVPPGLGMDLGDGYWLTMHGISDADYESGHRELAQHMFDAWTEGKYPRFESGGLQSNGSTVCEGLDLSEGLENPSFLEAQSVVETSGVSLTCTFDSGGITYRVDADYYLDAAALEARLDAGETGGTCTLIEVGGPPDQCGERQARYDTADSWFVSIADETIADDTGASDNGSVEDRVQLLDGLMPAALQYFASINLDPTLSSRDPRIEGEQSMDASNPLPGCSNGEDAWAVQTSSATVAYCYDETGTARVEGEVAGERFTATAEPNQVHGCFPLDAPIGEGAAEIYVVCTDVMSVRGLMGSVNTFREYIDRSWLSPQYFGG